MSPAPEVGGLGAKGPAGGAGGEPVSGPAGQSPVTGTGGLQQAAAPAEGQAVEPRGPAPTGWVYGLIWWLTAALFPPFFRPRRFGCEQIPRQGGALLCANHQSWLDIPLIGSSTRRPVRFVARHTLRQSRLLAFIMRRCGSILIQRGAPDKAALRAIETALANGELVAIFPEGTRTLDGRVGVFRGGALLAARRAGVPLIPVGIRGSYRAWPRGQSLPRPKQLGIAFGAPLQAAEADLEALRQQVAELAQEGLAAALPEAPGSAAAQGPASGPPSPP